MDSSSATIAPSSVFSFTVTQQYDGLRLDHFIAGQFPHYSRSFFKNTIDDKLVTINGTVATKTGVIIKTNDLIGVTFPPQRTLKTEDSHLLTQSGIKIVYQHADFAVIFKPAGILVHIPTEKSTSFCLVDWLIHHFETIKGVGSIDRPGIIHRLDRETSGLMLIALNNRGHQKLGRLFHDRLIEKRYLALVKGHPEQQGSLSFPIKRHSSVRHRMMHSLDGKNALTHFLTLQYFKEFSLVLAKPITGRTHQIRVHFTQQGHPLLGDTLYGTPSLLLKRHALHAHSIAFDYDDIHYFFQEPLPADLIQAIEQLER